MIINLPVTTRDKLLLVSVFILLAFGASLFTAPKAMAYGTTLYTGESLQNTALTSDNQQYTLNMQNDGNLVAQMWPRPYWATGSSSPNAKLIMQGDGNLVIYRVDAANNPVAAIWASGTSDPSGGRLVLQNDGNLVVIGNSRGLLWSPNATATRLYSGQKLTGQYNQTIYSPNRRYKLTMQSDGNVVAYDGTAAIWAKHGQKPYSTLEMQTDANLVLYDSTHTALWATNTLGNNGSYLEAQNDGNFVLYDHGVARWSTKGDTTPDVGGANSSAQLAQQILNLKAAGKIAINDYSENRTSDTNDRSLASLQLQDLAASKEAHLSMRCSYASQYKNTAAIGSDNATPADIRILRFLAELGSTQRFGINTLFGQCHSSVNSNHHSGRAVDFDCSWNSAQRATADSIGAKHGIKRNFETCANNSHWHYSVGGN